MSTVSAADARKVFAKSPAFGALPPEEVDRLVDIAQVKSVVSGEKVFLEGERAETMWMISDGCMRITKAASCSGRAQAVEVIGRGGFFGCAGCVLNGAYPCEATAASSAKLVGVPMRTVNSLVERYPKFAHAIILDMGERLRSANLMRSVAMESVEIRLIAVLLQLKKQFGRVLPFTRQNIGEMAGTTTETTIRTLQLFRKRGWLGATRGRILLIKPDEMEKRLSAV